MADIVITPANVVSTSTTLSEVGIIGETVTAGQMLYLKPLDQKWYKADCLTAEKAGQNGLKMALTGGTANQSIPLLSPGQNITIGGTPMAQGRPYFLSATAVGGALCPAADLVNTNLLVYIGYAQTPAILFFDPSYTGVALA